MRAAEDQASGPIEPPAAGHHPASAPANTARARIDAVLGDLRPTIGRLTALLAVMMALAFLAHAARTIIEVSSPGYGGEAPRLDFTVFWAAAKLALAGEPLAAFDPDRLREAMALPPGLPPGDLPWLYPPAWHMAVVPLGFLPFPAAYLVFSGLTLAAFAAAVRPLATPLPGGTLLVVAAPCVLIALLLGNMSLLWTAGLVGALVALARGRAALAGLLIALLTVKPQLGLLIPVALVAGGHWRTIGWGALGTAAVLSVSTAAMGLAYWREFLAAMGLMAQLLTTDVVNFERMMSWYGLLRFAGAGHALALGLQVAVALAAAAAVGWVWSRDRATFDLKAAALLAAIPLATPYAYHYEMTLALAAAVFLARDGFGAGRGARLWLLALWLGPVPSLVLAGILPPAVYAPPLVTATLVLCVARAARPRFAAG